MRSSHTRRGRDGSVLYCTRLGSTGPAQTNILQVLEVRQGVSRGIQSMSIPQEFKATSRLTYLVGSMGVDRQTYSTAHYESRRSAVCSRIRHCSVGKKERSKGYDAAIDCCYGLVGGKKRRRWGVQLRGEQVP